MSALCASAAPLALNLSAMGSAAAQAATDYKAIVCLFLYGGNDSINMVLPTDAASWAAYSTVRNQAPDSIALLKDVPVGGTGTSPTALGGVLPISPARNQGRSFALHPAMDALVPLFNVDKRLAILPNVGPLMAPTTKAQHGSTGHPLPANLYSHNDQQNTWQALGPEGVGVGWGGRLADALAATNAFPIF